MEMKLAANPFVHKKLRKACADPVCSAGDLIPTADSVKNSFTVAVVATRTTLIAFKNVKIPAKLSIVVAYQRILVRALKRLKDGKFSYTIIKLQ